MKKIKKQTAGDITVIICVAVICIIWLLASKIGSDTLSALIYQNGEVVEQVSLDDDREFVFGTVTIEIKDGKIRFASADCPDELCVKSGWLYKNGDTAACVPNKTVILIKGCKNKNVYAVTY